MAVTDAIDAAIATGELRVTYDGKTVEYRSIDDLLKARAALQAIAAAASGSQASRSSVVAFRKG